MRLLLTECEMLPQHAVLVGLSGGIDSVVLLHALRAAARQGRIGALTAAHLHHGLRGAAADADEEFCRRLCGEWEIPFCSERADVRAEADSRRLSMETAARELRYDFLRRAARRFGADCIAVAHHMDDQAETVLLHLIRGSGLAGLAGMRPRNGDIVRPLLRTQRREIEAYAAENKLAYCTDETNASDVMLRNRVRHTLLPALKTLNPRVVERLSSTADLLAADEDCLQALASAAAKAAMREGEDGMDRAALRSLEPSVRTRVLRQQLLLAQQGDVERRDIDRVDALLFQQAGTQIELRGGKAAWVDSRLLHVGVPPKIRTFSIPFAAPGTVHTPAGVIRSEWADFRRAAHACEAYVDFDALPPDTAVRTRRPGDRFHPLGAPGTRKLSDVMTDRKLPGTQRDLPLLCGGAEVLWMPGYTISERLKVTPQTKRVLHIIFEEEKRQ